MLPSAENEMGASDEADWNVPCSDDEDGTWEPTPEHIKEMYTQLAKGDMLALEWTVPIGGRRCPTPESEEAESQQEQLVDDDKTEDK